jgi:hypothetical protein
MTRLILEIPLSSALMTKIMSDPVSGRDERSLMKMMEMKVCFENPTGTGTVNEIEDEIKANVNDPRIEKEIENEIEGKTESEIGTENGTAVIGIGIGIEIEIEEIENDAIEIENFEIENRTVSLALPEGTIESFVEIEKWIMTETEVDEANEWIVNGNPNEVVVVAI